MSKAPWFKGRRKPSFVVRVDNSIYCLAKVEAKRMKLTLIEWVSAILRLHLEKIGKL